MQGRSTVGIKYLAQRSGCHSTNIQRWIESGVFGEVQWKDTPGGLRCYSISIEKAEAVIAMVRKTSTATELALAMGCAANALRVVAEAGAIRLLDIGGLSRVSKRLHTEDAYAFAQKFLRLACCKTSLPRDALPLPTIVLRMRKRLDALAGMLATIEQGGLQLSTLKEYPVRLDELFLSSNEISHWLKGERAP